MKTININISEYKEIKDNPTDYPLLYNRAICDSYEESMNNWLRLDVTDDVYDEVQFLKQNIEDKEMKVIDTKMYDEPIVGISFFSDSLVSVIGEQTVMFKYGKIIEQYIYNIEGVTPENGKPFLSMKSNIQLL